MKPSIIRAARVGLNWTQAELAERASIHPKSVAYWEGKGWPPEATPSAGALTAIHDAFALQGVLIEADRITFTAPPLTAP